MPGSNPSKQYSTEPNLVERKAAGYLQRRRQDEPGIGDDQAVHAASLRRIKRWAIIWAGLAGVLSGGVIGGSELLLRMSVPGELEDLAWREQLPYWAGLFAFAGLISGLEILFLYWNALKSIAEVRQIGESRPSHSRPSHSRHSELVALGLARAALEFPNPRVIIYGIDPYARLPNWRLTALSILYRLKVGVSSFALRIIFRRVFGRLMVRSLIPLLAGPLYAAWNAIITWRVIGEARVRAFGPAVVDWIIEHMDSKRDHLSSRAVEVIVHGIGELVMRGCDAHPNYVVLLSRLMEDREIETESVDVDWPKHRKELQHLNMAEQKVVLDVLTLASLLGSKLGRPQEEFLREIYAECRGTLRRDALKRLRSKLMDAEPVAAEDVAAVRS